MQDLKPSSATTKAELYEELAMQASALFEGESDRLANAANFCALVYRALPDVNWAGFYFFDGKDLVVGPFQGKPACARIPPGKGVCGAAASRRETLVVPDVRRFPGHIACDPDSSSELVVPIYHPKGELIGVWDVDSPVVGRFDEEDRAGMETLVGRFVRIWIEGTGNAVWTKGQL